MLRIFGQANYPGGPGSPEAAMVSLQHILAITGHTFIPDDISLSSALPSLSRITSAQLTDIYLLALAVKHGAKFLSLDRRIDPSLVPGGAAAYVQLTP